MRTAIVLLLLLALAAVPGSLLPQRSLTPSAVATYYRDHPQLAPVLDRLGMFEVFSSPWFAAVYLLLFTSLVGCLLPRTVEHVGRLRQGPPPTPRHLHRLPDHESRTIQTDPSAAAEHLSRELRRRRFRLRRNQTDSGLTISADRGRLKDTGNLVFHLSLLALLLALAAGKMWGYEGNILVTEGGGFCNSFQQYDRYGAGPLVDQDSLNPLCVDLEDFRASYEPNGTAASYTAEIAYQEQPGAPTRRTTIGVNDPLRLAGDRVYVTGHGFSPVFSITLPDGRTFDQLSAPFLPQDNRTFGSQGVVKVADLGDGTGDGFAIEGFFAPTGVVRNGVLMSADARPMNPMVAIIAYRGYLGLDSGAPQSVFRLDQRQVDVGALARIGAANLAEGESVVLDDGTTVRFDGYREFAAMQVSHDPAQLAVLIGAMVMLAGLLGNFLLRQHRVFVRVTAAPCGGSAGHQPRSIVSLAVLTRGGSNDGNVRPTELLDALERARHETPTAPTSPLSHQRLDV